MAIIIEDGTVVVGSNSYVSRGDYIAHAASIGITIVDDAGADVELIKSAEFINQHEVELKGTRYTRDQSSAYPRTGLEIDGWFWSHLEIPRQVILCQLAYALDVHDGIDLWNRPVNPNLATKRERVEGAIEVEYAIEKTNQKLGRTSTGDALLRSLLRRSGLRSIPFIRA